MLSIRVRPRIRRFSTDSKEAILERYRELIDSKNFPVQGRVINQHVSIRMSANEQHFWSPELSLDVTDNHLQDLYVEAEGKATLIRGFVGPKSNVWTLFMFFYIAFGLVFVFATMWGGSEWMLDKPTYGFYYAGAALLAMLVTFIATQIGQKIGEEQTELLLKITESGLK